MKRRTQLLAGTWALFLALMLAAGPDRRATVVILQTTDIHAHADPGWLQIATIVKRERRRYGPANVLLVDCGDTILGSQLAAVARGRTDVLMLNHLRYDAWIPGNHEVDAGVDHLATLIRQVRVPVLNGNLRLDHRPPFAAWRLLTKGKARIAVIGMNNPHLSHWLWGRRFEGYSVHPALPLLERLLPEIQRQNPDLIVLAIHQGAQERSGTLRGEVDAIGKRFPQIHLILGGHTHRPIPGTRVGNAHYVQAAARGAYVARIIAQLDLKRHRPIQLESSLLRTADYPADPQAKELLAPWLRQAARQAATVVARTPVSIPGTGRPGRDCHLSEIICRAIAAGSGADVVFHPVFSRGGWHAGAVTEADLFRAIPYDNTVGVALLSREDLAAIVREQLNYWQAREVVNGIWGLEIQVNLKSRTVRRLELPPGRDRVPTAFNSYVIAGAGSRFPELRRRVRQPEAKLREIPVNTRELLRRYLRTTPDWYAAPKCWIHYR